MPPRSSGTTAEVRRTECRSIVDKTYVALVISRPVADVFQVLADPTRRRLVEALRKGERSVSELVEVVEIGQPGVSRQLAILQDAKFVMVRPEGRRRLYRLRPDPFRELDDWMTGYRQMWQTRLDRFSNELDRRQKNRKQK
jgi:DNA-binding transcriptional ArsR family regulator